MEKRKSLRRVTEDMLTDYINNFYSGVYIEGLVQGNVLAKVRLSFLIKQSVEFFLLPL